MRRRSYSHGHDNQEHNPYLGDEDYYEEYLEWEKAHPSGAKGLRSCTKFCLMPVGVIVALGLAIVLIRVLYFFATWR